MTKDVVSNSMFNAISDIIGFFIPSLGSLMKRKRDEALEKGNPKIIATTIRNNLNLAANKAKSMGNEALTKFNSMLSSLPYASSPLMATIVSDARRKVSNAIRDLEKAQTDYDTEVEGIKDRADAFNQLDTDVKARRSNMVDTLESDIGKTAQNFENRIKEIEKYV